MRCSIWILVFVIFTAFSSVSYASSQVTTEYQLPYPGLLPDNPFYFTKTIRDRIVNFLITDSLKKIEFRLLQADKRLNAGRILFDHGKGQLSESTIAKGENYFEEAIREVKVAKNQGLDTTYLLEKMDRSAKKHEDVLELLAEKSDGQQKNQFLSLHKRVVGFDKEVNSLLPKGK